MLLNQAMNEILAFIQESLAAVGHPRLYETERGFQGAFLGELTKRLPRLQWEGAIVEQEYQKRMHEHGIRIRPDIIIHVPFDGAHHASRREGNFIVMELKIRATAEEALSDYQALSEMCEMLDYPLGVFINIGAPDTYLADFEGRHKERLHAFSVQLVNGQVEVRSEGAT